MTVAIHGRGIAANCCAHLLGRAHIPTHIHATKRPPVPAILLSDPALALLRDVFAQPALFADRPRIERRIVSWGGSEAVSVPHGAIVLSEDDLDAALGTTPSATEAAADFAIHTAPPFPAGELRHFGERKASAARIRLRFPEDRDACWVEAVAGGWLFTIPTGPEGGWMLAVGADPEALLAQSRHVAQRIELGDAGTAFPTHPRMLTALQGPDWLACGTAALGFDPICGDGTAQAVREAILACAVVGAMRRGGDVDALRMHHESMLIGAMRRHLRLSAQFYQTGGSGPWWQAQLAALAEGFDWTTTRLALLPEPRFALQGFDLVARDLAA